MPTGGRSISVVPETRTMRCGTSWAPGVMEAALADQPADVVDEVRGALTVMARERHDGAGVPLATGLWILTAVRSV